MPSFLSRFIGGAALTNALPHMISGQMGRTFPTPFAKPPGKGLSSAIVNVVWGFANLVLAYVLVCRIGAFDWRQTSDIVPLALGMAAGALMNAHHFGGLNGGNGPGAGHA
jgi:hypothetical protein